MWIFTNKGFISVVRHRDRMDDLLVRAREEDILKELFPDHGIVTTPEADYRYRVIVHEGHFARIMGELFDEINYDNFKNSIPPEKKEYYDACMDVWLTMYRF